MNKHYSIGMKKLRGKRVDAGVDEYTGELIAGGAS